MYKLTLAVLLTLLTACNTTLPRDSATFSETLIRHELADQDSYMGANQEIQPFFVTVDGLDMSPDSIGRLSDTGLTFRPGSEWLNGDGMRMSISAPIARADGDFDVSHVYYCGRRCAASVTSVMRRRGANWIVLSSKLQGISQLDAPNNSFKPNWLRQSA